MESAPIIKLEALTREFKEIIAISEISLEINSGELFGLIGIGKDHSAAYPGWFAPD